MSQEERDLLIRIDQNLINLTDKVTLHVASDLASFKEQGEDIKWLKKTVYLGVGGLFVLNIVIQFFKP